MKGFDLSWGIFEVKYLGGQMSFWGATVITNVLSTIPDLIEWNNRGVRDRLLKGSFYFLHYIIDLLFPVKLLPVKEFIFQDRHY